MPFWSVLLMMTSLSFFPAIKFTNGYAMNTFIKKTASSFTSNFNLPLDSPVCFQILLTFHNWHPWFIHAIFRSCSMLSNLHEPNQTGSRLLSLGATAQIESSWRNSLITVDSFVSLATVCCGSATDLRLGAFTGFAVKLYSLKRSHEPYSFAHLSQIHIFWSML